MYLYVLRRPPALVRDARELALPAHGAVHGRGGLGEVRDGDCGQVGCYSLRLVDAHRLL